MQKNNYLLRRWAIVILAVCFPGWTAAEKTATETVALEAHAIKDPKLIIEYQLSALDRLVKMTDRTKADLEALHRQILAYKLKQEDYLQHPDDKELLYQMAKSADEILNRAKSDHLLDALDAEFLSEISMLAQIYRKISLPKLP